MTPLPPALLFLITVFFAQQLSAQEDYKQYLQLDYAAIDSLKDVEYNKGAFDKAILLLQAGREKAKAEFGEQDSVFATYTSNLGFLYEKTRQYALSLPLYVQAKDIREKVLGKEHPGFATSLHNLAALYSKMGNYAQALPLYIQAKDIIEKVLGEEHSDFAISLNNLAALYWRMGDYAQALPLLIQAKDLREKTFGKEHAEFATSLNNLALLYQTVGNYTQALPLLIQAKDIWEKSLGKEHPDFASALNNLAGLYESMGDYARALSLYIQAKDLREKTLGKEHPSFATSLSNLALLYEGMGNYAQALPLYIEAKDIREKVLGKEHPYFALSLNNLAELYRNMGDYAQALPLYLQAKDIREKVLGREHPDFASSLNNLALLYGRMGNYDDALPLFIQAKDIFEKALGKEHFMFSISLNNLAKLYSKMGDYAQALTFYTQAKDIREKALGREHPDFALTLHHLAELHQIMGNYAQAEECYTACLSIKNDNLSKNFAWLSEKGKAAYWQKENVFYQNLNDYAAEAVADLPQAAVLAYNGNLIAKGLLLESAKEIEAAVANSKDGVVLQIYQELKDKKRLIHHLVSSGTGKKEIIARYENEADSLDKILVNRLGEYAASKKKFQISWKEVQNALSEDEMAIEFARYYNRQDSQYCYMALLLRKSYELPVLVKLGSEKAITAIPAGKGFAELYALIWEPIDRFLTDIKTVYYSPDGVLNNIAFAALCSKGTEKVVNTKDIKRGGVGKTGTETSNCTYLGERYTLHQLCLTRYLAEGLKNSKIDNSLLVFGGVNYDEIPTSGDTLAAIEATEMEYYVLAMNIDRSGNQSRMEYLPGTQSELQTLQKIMQKRQWKVRAFSDKNASENTLKAEIQKESPSVLHIATHGFSFPDVEDKKKATGAENKTYRDSDNPMARCGLLLAGSNHTWTGNPDTVLQKTGEDGILTALEVSNLPLKNTKLVVLSACETGLGKIEGTEGVFGLKRGFKLALAEQIVVSLWAVPDKESMELMSLFYNELAKTQDAVASFEKAQKDMRKKYPTRPDLWAGFVLVR